ncbi:MAG: DUF1269 domain-containing protein [Firmicutes bacterium]|nr:DUF1269 domain-containing protein [Bacillota bacterium]
MVTLLLEQKSFVRRRNLLAKTVASTFASRDQAERAVNELRQKGFDREISIVAKDEKGDLKKDIGAPTMRGDTVTDGATTGGVLGGLAGLAVGAGALAIPGLGPIVAAGPIAGLLSGAATGGIAGSLVDWGIPEAEGRRYEEDIKAGNILVAVRTDDTKANEASETLKKYGANIVKIH